LLRLWLRLRAMGCKEWRWMLPRLEHHGVENHTRQHACRCHKNNQSARSAQQKGKATGSRLFHACAARGLRENKIMICTCQSFPHDVTFRARGDEVAIAAHYFTLWARTEAPARPLQGRLSPHRKQSLSGSFTLFCLCR
jgi:hypothetical protein